MSPELLQTGCDVPTLVEPPGTFSMLHPCMHSKLLINIENTESTHGEIL